MVAKKLAEVLHRLAVRTRNSELAWEETEDENAFQVSFATSSIMLTSGSSGLGYRITVFNSSGKVIATATDTDLTPALPEARQLMHDTYALVRHQALKVDDTLDNTLDELKTDDDDLPF